VVELFSCLFSDNSEDSHIFTDFAAEVHEMQGLTRASGKTAAPAKSQAMLQRSIKGMLLGETRNWRPDSTSQPFKGHQRFCCQQ
jgi:hypothetical protein